MFMNLAKKIKNNLETPLPGFTLGFATAIAGACAVILSFPRKSENDPGYTITKSDFERVAETDDVLGIRNDLGHFKFYMDHS